MVVPELKRKKNIEVRKNGITGSYRNSNPKLWIVALKIQQIS